MSAHRAERRLFAVLTGDGRDAPWWRAVSRLGDRPASYGLAAARCLRGRGRGRWRPLAAVAGADAGQGVLKRVLVRPRPPRSAWRVRPHGASFPSRHTALAAAAVGRGPAAGAAVALVGASRIRLGVHWPGDVVGGWLLGAGCARLARGGRPAPGTAATAPAGTAYPDGVARRWGSP
ncbi:phosphatase PAP2 family protein [Kitasatospora sp. NA04385]|uniref:phosphatase PAP2 family protein n=1 Tax=Kitasatospora sp. NA04385 TaxID=2742135 RepID=UPI001591E21F|nr:phosphatase PAP2 family protein [Kitasatospora sp. NA04385]